MTDLLNNDGRLTFLGYTERRAAKLRVPVAGRGTTNVHTIPICSFANAAIARTVSKMDQFRVTQDNLPQAVESTLGLCKLQLQAAERQPINYALTRDLQVAVEALQLIDLEIHGETRLPRDRLSAAFTRYAIDEGDRMVMDASLKDLIVKIEDVYRRIRKRNMTDCRE